jgi:hypothetical protein
MEAREMPKKGQRFAHRYWLTEDRSSPLTCEITKIRAGLVYYRPVYADGLGKPIFCAIEDLPRYSKE